MSSFSDLKWNTVVKCKESGDNNDRIKVTIPDTTRIWDPSQASSLPKLERDNAPYFFRKVPGDFQVWVKVSGKFDTPGDQAGILIRQSRTTYMRCGFERMQKCAKLGGRSLVLDNSLTAAVAVVKDNVTDWSCFPIVNPKSTQKFYFCVKRRGNALVSYCSSDGETYHPMRMVYFSREKVLSVGLYGACPLDGIKVSFEKFEIFQENKKEVVAA